MQIVARPSFVPWALLVTGAMFGCHRQPAADRVAPSPGRERVPTIQWAPLADWAPHAGRTGFERLRADQTGIDFIHQWTPPEKYGVNIDRAFAGGGVAIGDYDNDGRPDIYLSRPFGGGRLYRNLGQFRFEDVTDRTGLGEDRAWGAGCSLADINGDGNLDLYVCGFDCPNRLFINQGDGTFSEQAKSFGLDFSGSSVMMAWADYDCDGDLDGYLVTNRPYVSKDSTVSVAEVQSKLIRRGQQIWMPEQYKEYIDLAQKDDGQVILITAGQYDHLLKNNGDGTFTDVSKPAGIRGNDMGLSATWWDYNGDRFPDLYVANDFFGPDRLYRNNGDGTMTDVIASALPHTPWFSMGTDVADINNDGLLDLMATDMSGTTHYKQKISTADMLRQGWFLDWPTPRQYMRNALYLNSGTDRFMEVAHMTRLANSDWTWAVRFADFDNDGWVDLFVANGMTGDYLNSDLRGAPPAARARSLKRDTNFMFRNAGNLQFQEVGAAWGVNHDTVSFGAATGDLDNDGDLDLVVNNFNEPPAVYRNVSSGGNRVTLRLRGSVSNRDGLDARVTLETRSGVQVRYLTSSRGFMSSGEPIVHFGLGQDGQIDRLTVDWPSGHTQVFEHQEANRHYTIVEPDRVPPPTRPADAEPPMFVRSGSLQHIWHRERPFDDFDRQPLLPNRLSQLGPGLACGDVDGDGDLDLYVGGAAGQAGRLYQNWGDGRFVSAPSGPSRAQGALAGDLASEDMGCLFFDADGDDDLDLYVVSGGNEFSPGDEALKDRLYLNKHNGFQKAPSGTIPDMRASGSTVVGGDFDRDGDVDLFVGGRVVPGAYPESPQSYLLENDRGRFLDVTDSRASPLRNTGMVTGAVWSDADGDGWLDLLVAHDWGAVKFYHNERGTLVDRTVAAGLANRLGWWNGITAGDVDNDGDMDYLVTNFGLNTKYTATPAEPVRLYYGDFDGSGRNRIIEAKQSRFGLLPVRGKSCSQNAMPFVRTRFQKYDDFAKATLEDIYGEQCLREALVLEVNCLESGTLINDGAGRFRFVPLPRMAQISPAFGSLVNDLDGDGKLDVVIVQNFFGPQRETGRMDGGLSLLLMGRGDGTFDAIRPDQSGLVIPGDATSAVRLDLNRDGWPDLVVATNNGELMAFENRPSRAYRQWRLVLRGNPGNRLALGTRVTVHFRNGRQQTAEVTGGGGYLSQSSHVLPFGLGADDAVDRVDVRWPNGKTVSHTPDPSVTTLTIEQEAAVRIREFE